MLEDIKKNVLDTARDEGIEIGKEIGMEKGMEQGLEKGRSMREMEIARKMVASGLSPEAIAGITS